MYNKIKKIRNIIYSLMVLFILCDILLLILYNPVGLIIFLLLGLPIVFLNLWFETTEFSDVEPTFLMLVIIYTIRPNLLGTLKIYETVEIKNLNIDFDNIPQDIYLFLIDSESEKQLNYLKTFSNFDSLLEDQKNLYMSEEFKSLLPIEKKIVYIKNYLSQARELDSNVNKSDYKLKLSLNSILSVYPTKEFNSEDININEKYYISFEKYYEFLFTMLLLYSKNEFCELVDSEILIDTLNKIKTEAVKQKLKRQEMLSTILS